jgi:hypothetical protein
MKRLVRRIGTPLGLAAAVACGDSTGVQPADLAGTWNVTLLEFAEVGGTLIVDLIDDLGATASVVIESNGSFQFTVSVGGDTDSDSGTLIVSGSDITMDFNGDAAIGTISRNGDTVTIELDNGLSFDFDDDGTEEDATARIVMVKQ